MSKRQVEFVKDDVINHIVTRTSSKRQMIKNVWQNTDILPDPRSVLICQLFCYEVLSFCIFVLGSHLIL